jgi:hypothetical protein
MSESNQLVDVTVVSALGQRRLGLAADGLVGALLPDLLVATGMYPSPAAARPDEWQLAVTDGPVLSADRALAEQGVKPGAVLHLRGVTTVSRTWTVVVRADRPYFDSLVRAKKEQARSAQFPDSWPELDIRLAGQQVQIGRRSTSKGLKPDIDLSGPPPDVGVSRRHAVLLAEPDGTWAILDHGSANGTLLNGTEVTPNERARLHDGDQINLGTWTALTIHVE